MRPMTYGSLLFASASLLVACDTGPTETLEPTTSRLFGCNDLGPQWNFAGLDRSASSTGTVDRNNPFFVSLGTNGRSCVTCHQPGEGWSITPFGVQLKFWMSDGTDPLFRPHDGANAPGLDVSTVDARRAAYSLMLERAVIRVGLPVKPTSEFELVTAEDPYGHASATQLSLFRRPMPTTNLRFIAAVNWDGRNTIAADPTNIRQGLKNQSNGATVNHAQAMPIDDATREAIVDFETSVTTAQVVHRRAGALDVMGATSGPTSLLTLPFSIGMNSGSTFDRNVFSVFSSWSTLGDDEDDNDERRDVAAGELIFNTRTFTIVTPAGSFEGTCSGCHNTPNVGSASSFRFFDVGVSSAERRASNVPLYTFRNKTTGETIQTTDPGRALITGLWADMNRFRAPSLRGLSARPPYFHDGSARDLRAVVDHYDRHFSMGLSGDERDQLVMFLESL